MAQMGHLEASDQKMSEKWPPLESNFTWNWPSTRIVLALTQEYLFQMEKNPVKIQFFLDISQVSEVPRMKLGQNVPWAKGYLMEVINSKIFCTLLDFFGPEGKTLGEA